MRQMMVKLAIVGVMACLSSGAQTGGQVQKIYEPKYLTGERGDRVNELLKRMLPDAGGSYWDPVLNAFLLKGSPENVTAAEALLRKFDVAERVASSNQISLTVYLVGASPDGQQPTEVPPFLEPVVKEMRESFLFKSFRLLDTIPMNTGSGSRGMEVSGMLSSAATHANLPHMYEARFQAAGVGDDGKSVWVRNFRFRAKIPIPTKEQLTYVDSVINSDLVIRPGQKLVFGKVRINQTDDSLFLVITAEPVK